MMKDEIIKNRQRLKNEKKQKVDLFKDDLIKVIQNNIKLLRYEQKNSNSLHLNEIKKKVVKKLTHDDSFILDVDNEQSIHLSNDIYIKHDFDSDIDVDYIDDLTNHKDQNFINNKMKEISEDIKKELDIKDLHVKPKYVQGCDYIKFLLSMSFKIDKYKISYEYEKSYAAFHDIKKEHNCLITFDIDFIIDILEQEGLNVTKINDQKLRITL